MFPYKKFLAAVLFATFFGLGHNAFAQSGSLSGTVTDSAGAVISGADVTAQNDATSATRNATTSASGNYSIANLQPGTYTVKVSASGFADAVFHGVQVTVAQVLPLDAKLSVGATTVSVDVSGITEAPIESDSSQLSTIVDARTIQTLPLITRDPYSLVLLSPGTVMATSSLGGFSVNGARERNNNFLVTNYPVLHVDTGSTNARGKYMVLTGTSMSTAVVSGAVALMVQANPSLTPNQVKAVLMYSAQIMDGADLFEQGAGMLNVEGAVRLSKSLSHYAFAQPVGGALLPSGALPMPAQTMIAGEPLAWSQSLIWGRGMMRGDAMLTTQQLAYAQSLIWGIGRFDAWGQGVSYYDGLYDDSYVVFGQDNQWNYVTWNPGTSMPSGLIWSDRMYASGLIWSNRVIGNDFFDVSSSSLIWGVRGYAGYDMSLIWGLRDAGLIWGLANEW